MWVKKQEYNQMRDMIKYLKDYKKELISKLETLGMFNEVLREEMQRRTALENRRKSDARMKERKESHEYAKLCLEKAKHELNRDNVHNAKLMFAEYENNIDYRVEEDAKKLETKTDAFNEAAKPLMEWIGKNCNPHHEAIVNCMGAQLMSGEIGVPSPMAIKYREENNDLVK